MDKFEELYRKDQYHISRWEKHYSNKEFYGIHQKIKDELEKLLNKKKKLTPKQKFICAMIYHHEFDISSSKKALKFVREAQAEGYFKQKWLIGSILDRLLQLQGKPQKYGTQIVELKNGKYKQYRLDSSVS
ncbi:MAG: hypothetical protein KKB29_00855, partial [Nanoarchaeota archaeon]|nr:hypothetical protein [Nanoarchaeota archaeon]